jgi:type IV secretion system protein VirB8
VVKSVTLLSPTTALVRFDAERRDAGSSQAVVQPYTAAIAFRWSGAPLRLEDRWLNPLGFQVTRYRRDAEAATSALPAALPTNLGAATP